MLAIELETDQHAVLTNGSKKFLCAASYAPYSNSSLPRCASSRSRQDQANNQASQFTDVRRETRVIAESTAVLWSPGQCAISETMPFSIAVPETLKDGSALLPSWDGGRRTPADGWKNLTFRHRVGWVRWTVQVKAKRDGKLKRADRSSVSIVVMPRSDAPPLLPETVMGKLSDKLSCMHELTQTTEWTKEMGHEKLTRGLIFGTLGHAIVSLYLPNTPLLCRGIATPFYIVVDLSSSKADGIILDWSKATMHLHRTIQLRARSSEKQTLNYTFANDFMHEDARCMIGDWKLAAESASSDKVFREGEMGSWVQQGAVAGSITFGRPPDFKHTQLSVHYSLRIEIPFPGISNCLRLEKELHFMSGCHADSPPTTDVGLDLPPDCANDPLRPDPGSSGTDFQETSDDDTEEKSEKRDKKVSQ